MTRRLVKAMLFVFLIPEKITTYDNFKD